MMMYVRYGGGWWQCWFMVVVVEVGGADELWL